MDKAACGFCKRTTDDVMFMFQSQLDPYPCICDECALQCVELFVERMREEARRERE